MSKRTGGWKRQSYQDTEAEIRQALGLDVPLADEIRQIADEQLEDSPYQARADYDEARLAELVDGMREAGFQGVVFVRPSPKNSESGREHFQLVYGHRRRLAWRRLCAERGQTCTLPVVVRQFSDQQMLTIGSQENIQRQDLSPLEEAQLVVWHQELYYPVSLAEIGRMLGKSEDWAKTRSRLAQLPSQLQEVVRRSPQLMTGVLELSRLWESNPVETLALAERAEHENLNLRQIRKLLTRHQDDREILNDRRVDTLNVHSVTNDESIEDISPGEKAVSAIDAATDQIIARLSSWAASYPTEAERAAIERGCERVMTQIQEIRKLLAESAD